MWNQTKLFIPLHCNNGHLLRVHRNPIKLIEKNNEIIKPNDKGSSKGFYYLDICVFSNAHSNISIEFLFGLFKAVLLLSSTANTKNSPPNV